jgi:hypothetical protein|tara:strand:- start:5734 stop:6117 length:384 start_codon:yes stop_codon:yes gene_type:complete
MGKNNSFYYRLILLSLSLFAINTAFNSFVYKILFIIPLWKIHVFNAALVLMSYWTLYWVEKTKFNILTAFIVASINKMLISIIFLSPAFDSNGNKEGLILTFFTIYFVFLFFEITSLKKIFLSENHS